MRKEFSTSWKASKQPRKQRKYVAKAPLHLKKKFLSVNLSKDLRNKHSKRNIPVKKGDTVKIMRGKHSKKQGKIIEVSLKNTYVLIENIQVKKQDGSKVGIKLKPSNLQIIELNLDGQKRLKMNKPKETKQEKSNKEKGEGKK